MDMFSYPSRTNSSLAASKISCLRYFFCRALRSFTPISDRRPHLFNTVNYIHPSSPCQAFFLNGYLLGPSLRFLGVLCLSALGSLLFFFELLNFPYLFTAMACSSKCPPINRDPAPMNSRAG